MQVTPEQWPSVSRLLDEALELSPEKRDDWLASLAPADAPFKPMLRTLLRHAGSAETRNFNDLFPDLPANVARSIRYPRAGDRVGPYVIEEEIGSGGMGAVWRARRSDGVIKRPVALKLPHAGPHGRHLIEMFMTERDILAKLAHPNIARLYDAGFGESGQPFLALEYVAGLHLTDHCDRHKLDIRRRLVLFQQVLRAVQYAHGHLIVHGDIKPSNVIVGVDGRAILLDFGVAKVIAAEAQEHRTPPRDVAMTPYYASPEQMAGAVITTASDVYSLGVLLGELLAGERLRRAPSRMFGAELDAIIQKAMRTVPAERYVTVDAFWQDVEHLLRGEPVSARPPTGWYRTRKLVARHRVSVAAGAVAVLATVATATTALCEARVASLERDRALAMSSRSEAVAEFLNVLITEAGSSEKPVTVSDMIERGAAFAKAQYRNNPEQRAAVLDMLGVYYQNTGREPGRGEQLLSDALLAVRSSRDGDLQRKLICDHAMALETRDRVSEATRALNAVIDDPETSPEQAAQCLQFLAYVLQQGGDYPGSLRTAHRALQVLQEASPARPTLSASILATVGFAEHLNGRNLQSEQFFERALAQFEQAGRDRGPEAVSVRNDWAVVSEGAGNPRRALEQYEQTLQLAGQGVPGAAPPPYLLANRAHALKSLGRYGAARESYLKCTEVTQRSGDANGLAACMLGLAGVAYEQDDLPGAEDWTYRAASVIEKSVPANAPTAMSLRACRATLAMAQGRLEQARALLESVIANSKDGTLEMALRARAEINLDEGKLAEAEADARRALAITQAAQGGVRYSDRTGRAWMVLGRVFSRQGNMTRAHDAFLAAITHLSNTVDDDNPALLRARKLAGG